LVAKPQQSLGSRGEAALGNRAPGGGGAWWAVSSCARFRAWCEAGPEASLARSRLPALQHVPISSMPRDQADGVRADAEYRRNFSLEVSGFGPRPDQPDLLVAQKQIASRRALRRWQGQCGARSAPPSCSGGSGLFRIEGKRHKWTVWCSAGTGEARNARISAAGHKATTGAPPTGQVASPAAVCSSAARWRTLMPPARRVAGQSASHTCHLELLTQVRERIRDELGQFTAHLANDSNCAVGY